MKKFIFYALMFISTTQLLPTAEAAADSISTTIRAPLKDSAFFPNDPSLRKRSNHHSKHHSHFSRRSCNRGPQGPQGLPATRAGAYILTTSTATGVRGNILKSSLDPIIPTSFGGANFFF